MELLIDVGKEMACRQDETLLETCLTHGWVFPLHGTFSIAAEREDQLWLLRILEQICELTEYVNDLEFDDYHDYDTIAVSGIDLINVIAEPLIDSAISIEPLASAIKVCYAKYGIVAF